MRNTMGCAIAAIVLATGCGGNGNTTTSGAAIDEHEGPNAVCGQCKVTGGGQLFLGEQRVQFKIEAIPESGPAAGAGFEGAGVAAKGQVKLQAVPASEGGLDLAADVDTIVSCGRTDGVLTATVSGTIPGDGRFTAVVTDGGEPSDDTLAFTNTTSFGPVAVANGNLQVHELDRCEAPCPEGQCFCPDTRACEPCDGQPPPPAPPPVCLEGTCWSAVTSSCEPCQPLPPPPPPPAQLPM